MGRVNQYDWSRRKISKKENFLMIFSYPRKCGIILFKKFKPFMVKVGSGGNPFESVSNTLKLFNSEKVVIPKKIVLATSDIRLTQLSLSARDQQTEEQFSRSVQYALTDVVGDLFSSPNDILECISNDTFSPNEMEEITSRCPDFDDLESFLEAVEDLDYGARLAANFITDFHENLSQNDILHESIRIDDETCLISIIPKNTINSWKVWAKEKKLFLTGCISSQLVHLLFGGEDDIIGYINSHSATLIKKSESKIAEFYDFPRSSLSPPTDWINTLDSLSEDDRHVILASESDRLFMEDNLKEVSCSKFSPEHFENIAKKFSDDLLNDANVRYLPIHPVYSLSPPIHKTVQFWQKIGIIAALVSAVYVYLPKYKKKNELLDQVNSIERRIQTENLNLQDLKRGAKDLEKIEKEIEIYSTGGRSTGKSNRITFWKSNDVTEFIKNLSISMQQTPNVQIDNLEVDWKGNIQVNGTAPGLGEARFFIDEFIKILNKDSHPDHVGVVELNEETDNYLIKISPQPNN